SAVFSSLLNVMCDTRLPLTVLSVARDTEVLILEMGMTHFHEIERLSCIAEPDYAVITNIGESHNEYLGSREGMAQAKLEIKAGLKIDGKVLIDDDETLLQSEMKQRNTIGNRYTNKNNNK